MDLINQTLTHNEDGELFVDARSLHKVLGVGRDFTHWIKDRIEKFGFSEGKDYQTCSPNLATEIHGGHNRKDYKLSLPTAKEIAMVENNEVGRRIRLQLIKIEEAWNREDLVIARALVLSDKRFRASNKELGEAREKIAQLAPKAEEWENYLNAQGLISFQKAANQYGVKGIGRTNLFSFCRENHILINAETPYREHIEAGRFIVRAGTRPAPNGQTIPTTTVYLTTKGFAWLGNKLKARGHRLNSTWDQLQLPFRGEDAV